MVDGAECTSELLHLQQEVKMLIHPSVLRMIPKSTSVLSCGGSWHQSTDDINRKEAIFIHEVSDEQMINKDSFKINFSYSKGLEI
jgi:hypothetical protein